MRSHSPGSGRLISGIALGLVMVLIAGVGTAYLAVRQTAFCAPAAHLAGLLSGAPCVKDGADYRLIGTVLDLTVVPACAAADYFCLLTGFLSVLMLWRGLRLYTQLFVMPLAWIATILINALRLIACWHTDRLAQDLLPQMLWPATHMAVGIMTFLAGLIFIFWVGTKEQRRSALR